MGFYISVERDVKVYIEDINPGGKKTVFFVHGWPGSHNLFEYQFNVLPQMGIRCIGNGLQRVWPVGPAMDRV